jgi:hypothetical protein
MRLSNRYRVLDFVARQLLTEWKRDNIGMGLSWVTRELICIKYSNLIVSLMRYYHELIGKD